MPSFEQINVFRYYLLAGSRTQLLLVVVAIGNDSYAVITGNDSRAVVVTQLCRVSIGLKPMSQPRNNSCAVVTSHRLNRGELQLAMYCQLNVMSGGIVMISFVPHIPKQVE